MKDGRGACTGQAFRSDVAVSDAYNTSRWMRKVRYDTLRVMMGAMMHSFVYLYPGRLFCYE